MATGSKKISEFPRYLGTTPSNLIFPIVDTSTNTNYTFDYNGLVNSLSVTLSGGSIDNITFSSATTLIITETSGDNFFVDLTSLNVDSGIHSASLSGNTFFINRNDGVTLGVDFSIYNYTDEINSHTGDTSIHFTKNSIYLSDLGSSAHTHSTSEITNIDSIRFTGGTVDNIAVTSSFILTAPTTGSSITQILSRNPSTGLIEYVSSTEFVSTSQLARNTAGTGILYGGYLTQSGSTHINIAAGAGTISLHLSNGDTSTIDLVWTDKLYVSVPTTVGLGSYVFINSIGDVTFKTATDPAEPGDLRSNIYLGLVGHSALSAITTVISAPIPAFNVINTVDELAQGIGPFSLDGNSIMTASGTSLNITSGSSYQIGGNLHNELNLPNILATDGLISPILNMVKSTAFLGPGTTECPFTQWDNLGTLTTLTNANDAAAHRIWYQPTTNKLYFQYGQTQYTNLTNAINGYSNESFVTPTNLTQNSYLVAVICASKNCVDWTVYLTPRYKVIPQSKFASKGGGGVGAFDTLQSTYNNSTTPEILTDSTRGALTIKNGSGSGDNVSNLYEGKNTADITTSIIRADGSSEFTSISASTMYVGSSSGKTTFDTQGHMVATGNAIVWDDFVASLSIPATGGAAPDTVNYTIFGVPCSFFTFDGATTEERLTCNIELYHSYAEGTDLHIHAHIMPSTINSGNVVLYYDYFYSKINAPATSGGTLSVTIPISANTQYQNYTHSIGQINGSNLKIGDFIIGCLRRTPTGIDTYPDDIMLQQVAAHCQMDTHGSRQKFIK